MNDDGRYEPNVVDLEVYTNAQRAVKDAQELLAKANVSYMLLDGHGETFNAKARHVNVPDLIKLLACHFAEIIETLIDNNMYSERSVTELVQEAAIAGKEISEKQRGHKSQEKGDLLIFPEKRIIT